MSDRAFVSEGKDAYCFGEDRSDCPYPKETRESSLWLDGWEEEKYDAERLRAFNLDVAHPMLARDIKGSMRSR